MADSSTAIQSYDLLLGPLVVGLIIDTIVFGLCFMLAARYLLLNFRDGWTIKGLLIWTFVLNAFQIGSETSMLWHYVVTNFMNPSVLTTFPWQYSAVPLFTSLVSLPIQLYLARRVMQLSGATVPSAIMAAVAVAQAVLNIITSAHNFTDSKFEGPQITTKLSLIVSAVSTAVITFILAFFITKRQRKIDDDEFWNVGYYLWVFAASAAPSTILSVIELAMFFSHPDTNLHLAFAIPVARLYTTALLANLNERKATRTQSDTATQGGRPISLGVLSQNRSAKPKTPVHITISQNVDVQMESVESDKVSDKHAPFASDYSPSTPQSGYSYGTAQPQGLGY